LPEHALKQERPAIAGADHRGIDWFFRLECMSGHSRPEQKEAAIDFHIYPQTV
jgi:hypothetical protein